MKTASSSPSRSFPLLLLTLCTYFVSLYSTFSSVLGDAGSCFASLIIENEATSKPLYWKVTNPTLSPSHLQDLPSFTRSVYERDHAIITPKSHVFSPLPEWTKTLEAYLITPEMGAHFVMYLGKMQDFDCKDS
ncbi:hypothetical protein SLEP1_g58569 [Rubroshorea leprosula]|uniref:Uncharacterized protein n=1 Tax=Rubroshorea leprosula TaxID=152421 RepID=A0AAV5MTB9_9ROSI|nr:hypothetical protein SLEP1_g58569 [Rubroshorea leprosula]